MLPPMAAARASFNIQPYARPNIPGPGGVSRSGNPAQRLTGRGRPRREPPLQLRLHLQVRADRALDLELQGVVAAVLAAADSGANG